MVEDIDHAYDEYIDPILSDESIWASEHVFTAEKARLYLRLLHEGYSKDFILSVAKELSKRWGVLIDEYLERVTPHIASDTKELS